MIKINYNDKDRLLKVYLSHRGLTIQLRDEEPSRCKDRNFCKFGDKFNFLFLISHPAQQTPGFHLALPAETKRKVKPGEEEDCIVQ